MAPELFRVRLRAAHNVMTRPRILLADDHTLMVDALKLLLKADFDVVGTARDGRQLLDAAEQLQPELVVVDIGMPLLNGLDAAERLKALRPEIKVIILTQNRDPLMAAEAFRRRASGYLLKDSAGDELIVAIQTVLKGGQYLSPSLRSEDDPRPAVEPAARPLNLREREVLQLLAEGKSMKEVGAILNISARTVEFHKYKIMQLLGAKTGAELVQYAIKHGLISP
jgi:DNA-binding NarL/FixJ family response regulator